MARGGRHLLQGLAILLALAGYLAALNYRRDEVPPGLNNDVAEEGVRGIQLVEAGRLEAINSQGLNRSGAPFGHSMETLYLYLVGFASRFAGSTRLAVHVVTWFFVLGSVLLLCLMVRRVGPSIPIVIPLLLAMSSVWLFHYGRSGLRAVTAPMFLLAFALALDGVERAPGRPLRALLCGAILGASLYGYTSSRILPVAFLAYVAVSLIWRERGAATNAPAAAGGAGLAVAPPRKDRLRAWTLVAAGALVVSIPNLMSLLLGWHEFLARGSYVLPAHVDHALWNFLGSVLLPIHYPEYARAVAADHHFDGVSFGLTTAGLRPVHPIIGLAVLWGVVRAWRRRREPLMRLLLCFWGATLLALGIAGPSLTRFLILLPVFLTFAALGIEPLLVRKWTRGATVAALLLLTVSETRAYFARLSSDPQAAREFAEAATDIGRRARELAAADRQVLCVVAGNGNVVNYLTHDDRQSVWISEFWHRAPDTREIPLQRAAPQVILLERAPGLQPLDDLFASFARRDSHPLFDEFVVDPAWDWRTLSMKEGPDSPMAPVAGYLPVSESTSTRITM
jgi:hypothetical protein